MNARKAVPTMLLAILLGGCASVAPGVARHGDIRIDHMVIPAAAEVGTDIAAYAGFDNSGSGDRLLGIDCTCAAAVELHWVVRDGDKVTMTNTFPLVLPAGARTEVRPPGIPLHFMLMRTTRAFAVGDRIPMRLRFERAGDVEVVFTVAATSKEGWERWPAR